MCSKKKAVSTLTSQSVVLTLLKPQVCKRRYLEIGPGKCAHKTLVEIGANVTVMSCPDIRRTVQLEVTIIDTDASAVDFADLQNSRGNACPIAL